MKNINKLVFVFLVCVGLLSAPLAKAFTYDNSYANKEAGAKQSRVFRSATNLTALSIQSVSQAIVNRINSKKPPQGVYTEAYQTDPAQCGFTAATSFSIEAPTSPLIKAVCAVDTYTVSSSGTISAKVYVWGVPNPQSEAYVSAGLDPGSNAQLRADYAISGSLINRFKMVNASTGVVQPGHGVEYLASSGGPHQSGTSAGPPPITGSTTAEPFAPVVYFTWSGTNGGGSTAKPTVNLSASPTSVAYGGASTLTWSSSNATSCTLNSASVAKSGSKSTGALYSSKSYTLSCTGQGGSNSASVTVSVGSPPKPSVSVSASPNPVNYGQNTTVSWSSSNTNSCTFGGGGVGTSGSKTEGPMKTSQTFTVSCKGPGGTANGSVSVNVTVSKPKVSLSASPNPVAYGGLSSLMWSSTHTTSCSLTGFGKVATSGTKSAGHITSPKTYSITCKGPGGSATASVTIKVNSPPKPRIFMMKVSPTSLSAPGSVTISYFTRNASSCYLSPGGPAPTGGSFRQKLKKVEKVSSTTTFTLQCTGPGGTASTSKTVTVGAPKPSITFTDRWSSVRYGGRDYLSWTSSNASSCTLNGRSVALNATGYATPRLYKRTTYTLSCKGPGGSVSKSLTISVSTPPKPRIRWFTYTPSPTVPYDTSARLHWGSANTNYCTVNGVRHGTSGPLTVGPLKVSTAYTLKCYGPGGSVSRSLTVRVASPPKPVINFFTARPGFVTWGNSSTLRWSTSNARSCSIDGVGVAVNGSESSGSLNFSTTFTLRCSNPAGSVSASVTVSVLRTCRWFHGRRICN